MDEQLPRHSNPTRARWSAKDRQNVEARAPYNFVPLPERIVLAQPPLSHDIYHTDAYSGWLDCDLETCSPTYIRGMLSETVWNEHKEAQEGKGLNVSQKENEAAPFFAVEKQPVIPGSSLRGMIRSLVEIVGYGRMRWVGDRPTFSYRAVAASRDDPLRDPYQTALGRFGANVRAGFLIRKSPPGKEQWCVRPAPTSRLINAGGKREEAYLKVKERHIGARDIPGFIRFGSSDYKPQLHLVGFNAEVRRDGRGTEFVAVTEIGPRGTGLEYDGILVCTGNMMETGSGMQRSPRKNHALVIDGRSHHGEIEIPEQVVEDYRKSITDFIRDQVAPAWGNDGKEREHGVLHDGKPVFYIEQDGKVTSFGHAPNFRVASRVPVNGKTRAGNPRDFVPEWLRNGTEPDLADALFGWVAEQGWGPQQGARAGRVTVGDGRFVKAAGRTFYSDKPITPHVLSTPKPTTFQHYLVQDSGLGHDPENKSTLAHYGTPTDKTTIRGHKLYWHKGESPAIEATVKERQTESQLTRIQPLAPGVSFRFRIHFDNLREEELGALLWVLSLPGMESQEYRHKLGMGKPLGMGAVKITPHLVLTDRKARYRSLFEADRWNEAAQQEDSVAPFLSAFEEFVINEAKLDTGRLRDVPRIQALLSMLAWPGPDPALTRYMEIEREPDKINEYKERPVLAEALVVADNRLLTFPQTGDQVDERHRRATGKANGTSENVAPVPQRAPQPAKSGPTLPAVGDTFTSTVLNADETAVAVEIPGFAPERAIGLIRAENLGTRHYVRDAKARVEVTAVGEPNKNGRQLIELRPAPKKGKK